MGQNMTTSGTMMKDFCTLSLACDDKPGLVARVAGYVAGVAVTSSTRSSSTTR
jgi:formyltetrahydrofolate hydrolase